MDDTGDDLVAFDADLIEWMGGLDDGVDAPPSPQEHEAPVFLANPPPVESRLHLLLGDSVARDAGFEVAAEDLLLRRAVGGLTWERLASQLDADLRTWWDAVDCFGCLPGTIIVWLSGNDVYEREVPATTPTSPSPLFQRKLDYAARCAVDVLLRLQETGKEVVVLGPLPRPRHDLGGRWEGSPAFHLERRLRTVAPAGVKIMNLGRQLTKSKKKRNLVSTDVLPYFRNDRLHLSLAGYQRLAPHLPAWLRISGAETC